MLKEILLYLWQLPQNLLGLILRVFITPKSVMDFNGIKIYYDPKFPGGISLGKYIILDTLNNKAVHHEYGHTVQSKWLGPFYLIVVGLPSIIHAWIHDDWCTNTDYYHFITEKSADKLGGVKR